MKTATLTETKNHLSALIDQVRQGETILVLDRGRPVARLESATTDPDTDGRLARLERMGAVLRASVVRPEEVLRLKPPAARSGNALEALLAERREGR